MTNYPMFDVIYFNKYKLVLILLLEINHFHDQSKHNDVIYKQNTSILLEIGNLKVIIMTCKRLKNTFN